MTQPVLEQFDTVRTTVSFPKTLIERGQHFVDVGIVPSRNALIVAALESFLDELEGAEIDRQFAAMADDEAYRAFASSEAEAFAESDWEALTIAEGQGHEAG
ncbi:MAG: hypothetical protein KC425_12765 [Anaerolineales bacterium]|nr:hypothetical protein [Anaerolineales bacterium]